MRNKFLGRTLAIPLVACIFALTGCKPIAQMDISEAADQPTTIQFSSQNSTDKDGTIVGYKWDFGDGQTSTEANPIHVYSASGSYDVKLIVVDNDGEIGEAQRTLELTRNAVSQVVGQGGATVDLPEVISLKVPAEAFSQPVRVAVSQTAKPETQADFDETSAMLQSPKRAQKEVRVNVGNDVPLSPILVKMKVPADLLENMGPEDEVAAYVQVYQDNGQAIIDSFELVRSTLVDGGASVEFDLLPEYFANTRTDDQSFEVVILIGSSKTKPPSTALMRNELFTAALCPFEWNLTSDHARHNAIVLA